MNRLIVFSLVLLAAASLAAAAVAGPAPVGNTDRQAVPVLKGDGHVGLNPGTPDGREGGETLETALVIDSLPYVDTGNTCDNIDDYDEMCPYQGNAPDVVYSFSSAEYGEMNLSLCSEGNQYDTKIFIYQDGVTPGSPWACNDDYCSNSWTPYASYLGYVPVFPGHVYYILIDGYGSDCGQYELQMEWVEPCVVTCPETAVPEGEPPLVDGYVDEHNCGCTPPYVWQAIDWINEEDGCAWLCGVSGWYDYLGMSYRDTDWFTIHAAGEQIDLTITAEYQTYLFVLMPPDCSLVEVVAYVTAEPCVPTVLSYPTVPGEEVWLWVGPTTFDGPVYEYDYFLHVCGAQYDVIPTENASWGAVKEMFR